MRLFSPVWCSSHNITTQHNRIQLLLRALPGEACIYSQNKRSPWPSEYLGDTHARCCKWAQLHDLLHDCSKSLFSEFGGEGMWERGARESDCAIVLTSPQPLFHSLISDSCPEDCGSPEWRTSNLHVLWSSWALGRGVEFTCPRFMSESRRSYLILIPSKKLYLFSW